MLLGFHSNGLQNHRLDEALRLLADHGYRAVALTPDVGHLDPLHCTAAEVARIAALLDRLELRVVMETGARFVLDPARKHEPTLMTRDPAERARRLGLYDRIAAMGADLGAAVLSFWSGVDRRPGPDSADWLLEGLALTCEVVRNRGLLPALEPEPGMAVATLGHYREVRARLGAEAPDLCLDVGHLFVEDEGDPVALIAGIGAELIQVHLEDMRRGVHEHLVPGEGEVDFGAVIGALGRSGYGGPVCFELSRSSHRGPEVVALCRKLWAEVTGA